MPSALLYASSDTRSASKIATPLIQKPTRNTAPCSPNQIRLPVVGLLKLSCTEVSTSPQPITSRLFPYQHLRLTRAPRAHSFGLISFVDGTSSGFGTYVTLDSCSTLYTFVPYSLHHATNG